MKAVAGGGGGGLEELHRHRGARGDHKVAPEAATAAQPQLRIARP